MEGDESNLPNEFNKLLFLIHGKEVAGVKPVQIRVRQVIIHHRLVIT